MSFIAPLWQRAAHWEVQPSLSNIPRAPQAPSLRVNVWPSSHYVKYLKGGGNRHETDNLTSPTLSLQVLLHQQVKLELHHRSVVLSVWGEALQIPSPNAWYVCETHQAASMSTVYKYNIHCVTTCLRPEMSTGLWRRNHRQLKPI